jgi:hypothetical protein
MPRKVVGHRVFVYFCTLDILVSQLCLCNRYVLVFFAMDNKSRHINFFEGIPHFKVLNVFNKLLEAMGVGCSYFESSNEFLARLELTGVV